MDSIISCNNSVKGSPETDILIKGTSTTQLQFIDDNAIPKARSIVCDDCPTIFNNNHLNIETKTCDSALCPIGYEMIGTGGLGSDIPGCGLEGPDYGGHCDVRINIAYNPTECALHCDKYNIMNYEKINSGVLKPCNSFFLSNLFQMRRP